MRNIEEMCLTPTAGNIGERLEIIRTFTPKLVKLTVAEKFVRKAVEVFGSRVEIIGI
jgi:hypothetical protein